MGGHKKFFFSFLFLFFGVGREKHSKKSEIGLGLYHYFYYQPVERYFFFTRNNSMGPDNVEKLESRFFKEMMLCMRQHDKIFFFDTFPKI